MRAQQADMNLRRNLTRAGNLVDQPVPLAATTLDVTLPLEEQDANYGVSVTPNWNTDFWVTLKTTTGYRINFSAGAPADAAVDSTTYRRG